MKVGIRDAVSARVVGDSRLNFMNNYYLNLNNVLYIPSFYRNLISVSKLLNYGYLIFFNNKFVIVSRNRLTICTGNSENNLYVIRPLTHSTLLSTEMFKVEKPKTKRKKISHDETCL